MATRYIPSVSSSPVEFFVIRVEAEDTNSPHLGDLASLIYDFNLVYEISRLATDPRYQDYKFSRFVWNRNRRPLKDQDRLLLQSMKLESPLVFTLVVPKIPAAIASIWGLVQITERIADWNVNRRIRRLELDKLEKDRDRELARNLGGHEGLTQLRNNLHDRGAEIYYEQSTKRLATNEMIITDIKLNVVSVSPPETK